MRVYIRRAVERFFLKKWNDQFFFETREIAEKEKMSLFAWAGRKSAMTNTRNPYQILQGSSINQINERAAADAQTDLPNVSGRRRRRRAARRRRTGGAGTPAAVSPWPGPAELMTKKQQVPAPITHSPCGGRLQEVGTRSGSEREKQRGRSLSPLWLLAY